MRDPALLAECRALQRAVSRWPRLSAMRGSAEWPALAERFATLFHSVRRYEHAAPEDAGGSVPGRVRAVHWNIEHGNWYEPVERALLDRDELRDADLLFFNEIDLGMARAGNLDVTGSLARALRRNAVWVPMFLETTLGRDDDVACAAGRENEESLFGVAILSRWPIGAVRVVDLPSPEAAQFDLERMVGRNVALIAEIARPGAPFVAATAHLEVHRTRAHRAAQMDVILDALKDERRPVILGGDWNTHTFDRALWHSAASAGATMLLTPGSALRRKLLRPDRGAFREPLFDRLRAHGFEWERWNDGEPTLKLRLGRIDEAVWVRRLMGGAAARILAWAEGRGALRLDWLTGRGWSGGSGRTVAGLDGPGRASDHAPIAAEFLG